MIGSLADPVQALLTARMLVAQLEPIAAQAKVQPFGAYASRLDLPRYIRARHDRREYFGEVFADLSWDMLLGLVLSEELGRPTSVSALCLWSDGPPTTALRHVGKLERAGLIVRVDDTCDHRRQWVELTDFARTAWSAWSASLALRTRPA